MAKLLEAGFGIREACKVLLATKPPAAQAGLLADLTRGLESGSTIAGAFSQNHKSISAMEHTIVEAGERSGKLAPAFQHLADYFGMIASIRREMGMAMIYPLVILHLGIFIGVIPTAMMKGTAFGQIASHFILTLLGFYVAAAILAILFTQLLAAAANHTWVDRLLSLVPFLGKARLKMAMARFCRVYHSCLLAGISMKETVMLSATASQSARLFQAGKNLAEAVARGNSLGPQFIAASVFPQPFSRSYLTGEEAGTLDKDMAHWASYYQTEAIAGARLVASIVPKFLYFIILGYVAWQIIGFFQNYYGGMLELMES